MIYMSLHVVQEGLVVQLGRFRQFDPTKKQQAYELSLMLSRKSAQQNKRYYSNMVYYTRLASLVYLWALLSWFPFISFDSIVALKNIRQIKYTNTQSKANHMVTFI